MKKILTLTVAALASLSAGAQTQTETKALVDSKPWDNWYFGVNAGIEAKTTHNTNGKINPLAGVRVGRWFTPCFGLMVEDGVAFSDYPYAKNYGNTVTRNTFDMGATINFSNWFGGYKGEPYRVEVIGVPALGWTHMTGTKIAPNINQFNSKLAVDVAVNLGKKKAFQLYVEPAFLYNIYQTHQEYFDMDINRSRFQVNVGCVYKFKNTNGTHNFKYAEPQIVEDETRINQLNNRINELRGENERLKALLAQAQEAANKQPAPVVEAKPAMVMPVVIFRQNSSRIQAVQYAEIERVAQFMKEHEDACIEVKGYASKEGNANYNQRLSERRAKAVADVLVKNFKIDASRISISSHGATSEQSATRAFNRVVTFAEAE